MRRVIVESPYAARTPEGTWDPDGVEKNLEYLRACMNDCLTKGEAPYASHALYTQPGVLDDQVPDQRSLGMRAGFVWNEAAEAHVVYVDRGVSKGMEDGIKNALLNGRTVEYRSLGEQWRTVPARDIVRWLKENLPTLASGSVS